VARSAPGFFYWFEVASVLVFTAEYLLRLWCVTSDSRFAHPIFGRLRHAGRPMSLVDLAAIAPFYLHLFFPGALDLRFLRSMRLLRIFRLLRAGRAARAFGMLARVVQAKRVELGVTIAVLSVAVLVAAGAIYMAEHDQPKTLFTSIPRAMWWSIVTITTVGYGDMTPVTPIGQVIGGIVAFLGICAIALPVGILSSGYIDEINRMKGPIAASDTARTCPHCGGDLDGSRSHG
jgi:voltage-gated potassium channel